MQYAPYYANFLVPFGLPLAVRSQIATMIAWSIILISQFVGAIAYPIGGSIADRTKTKYGKYRPFFLLAIPSAIALLLGGYPALLRPLFMANIVAIYIFLLVMCITFFITWRMAFPAFMAYYTNCFDESEKRTLSVVLNGGDIGAIILAFIIPVMIADFVDIEVFSYIFAAMTIIPYLLLFFFGSKEPKEVIERPPEPSMSESLAKVLRQKHLKVFIIATFFFNFGYMMISNFLVDYLETFGLSFVQYLIYFGILIISVGAFAVIFLKKTKDAPHLSTFRKSLLFMGCTLPLILIFGAMNWGFFTRDMQIILALIIILMGVIGYLIYSYVVLIDLANMHPGIKGSFMGVFNFIGVLAQPVATVVYIGLQVFNLFPVFPLWAIPYPVADGITYVFGYCLVGIVSGLGFLASYIILGRLEYEEKDIETSKINEKT